MPPETFALINYFSWVITWTKNWVEIEGRDISENNNISPPRALVDK